MPGIAEAASGLEALPGLWSLTPLGFGLGTLALLFIGLATGFLYTRRQHLEIVGLLKDALEARKIENTELKAAYAESSAQVTRLTEALGIIPDFFAEVDAIRDEPKPGGENDGTTRRARRAAQARAGG